MSDDEKNAPVVDHDVLIIERVRRNGFLVWKNNNTSYIFYLFSYILMSLKTTKIIYRVATLALALFILPGLFFMNSEMAIEGLKHVGLTDAVWLQQLLGRASPVAIIGILIESFYTRPCLTRLKERAYAGLAFVYIGAFWAHLQLGDPMSMVIMPVVTFVVLMVSYCMWHKMMKAKA